MHTFIIGVGVGVCGVCVGEGGGGGAMYSEIGSGWWLGVTVVGCEGLGALKINISCFTCG